MDINYEFPINESRPVALMPNVLMRFKHKTIKPLIPQMKDI